jgi:triosephosphate isomerase
MNKTVPESVEAARRLVSLVATTAPSDVEVMIAPAFTALSPVAGVVAGTRVGLGAQDIHWEASGAFTGEVSAAMLVSAGCGYAVIGHSERRQFFHETDETVNRKIGAASAAGLVPVFCVGETEAEREAGKTARVLDKQIEKGLEGHALAALNRLVIAYEPVWAIGTGKTATREQAQEAHAHIRRQVEKAWGAALAKSLRILYGGSVKPDNVADLMAMDDVDGALVGGASLDPEVFARIVAFNV